jgi:hypothetical protein
MMTRNSSQRGRSKNEKVENQANREVRHIIRVLGNDGLLHDICMTEAQVKETRNLARYPGHDCKKQTFHDLLVALLDEGVLIPLASMEASPAPLSS